MGDAYKAISYPFIFLLVQLKLQVLGVIQCSAWPWVVPTCLQHGTVRVSRGLAVAEVSHRVFQIAAEIFNQSNKRPSPPAHMCSPCKAAGSLRAAHVPAGALPAGSFLGCFESFFVCFFSLGK